ncbi:zinc finger BED domain-containing protein 1-like [Megalops cyprinoides]|uniref:zinc finger BED domain-containing protein 1-like n=1 Tax=Megalops cyprinoides TaxID=118141 RepID=UPI001864C2C7|nr:zinc finger BED domain-containing protein 1-like [Megalops cyprinoides]
MDEQKETLYVCSAMDPRFKAFPFLSDDECQDIYIRAITEAAKIQGLFQEEAGVETAETDVNVVPEKEDSQGHVEVREEEDISAGPSSKRARDSCTLADLLGETYGASTAKKHRTTQDQAEEEMTRYKEAASMSLAGGNPLNWWKEHQSE